VEAAFTLETQQRLRSAGVAVVYVTHRLSEVARLADRASVLRDGKLVGTVRVSETTERVFATLSGGNQQKVVLSKWMTPMPDVLVADEPTAGIDVGTKAAIYDRLADAARTGTAVLLSSSDADEVAGIADRVIVFAHGTPRVELRRDQITAARIAQECFVT
jgi:ribose transport system ATP-binding protein